ncbi:MAG: tRNA (adenosine(37)-N6)-threonylcarbamoyltransferase complex transferase subunit TsaD [Candidatus Aceula meridiana]|nr:tRNA (adenosine(37)-N6)-threonylcarbamoyltransferase complex transferase subunit TsaD [Candidatus Aceula meridiana]
MPKKNKINILGIETSCDETAASVIQSGKLILSNVVASSLHLHKKYGGIIPEIASRKQLELIDKVVERALKNAKLKINDIHAIAVTTHPGLVGSLLVGISWARALSYALKKPLIEIDHIKAHLYAGFLKDMKSKTDTSSQRLPAVGLVASGGHSSLFYVKSFDNFKLLGQTRDDAAGEAYDKVARILGLGYPGGPVIDRLAKKGKNKDIHFPRADLGQTLDFSFSGLKTAVYYYEKKWKDKKSLPINKIAYAFQESVVQSLVKKSISGCLQKKVKTLIVGGGVAANSALRKKLQEAGQLHRIKVIFPSLNLCMDNAAMIAGLGYHFFIKKQKNKGRKH